jgi:hypothetical protein
MPRRLTVQLTDLTDQASKQYLVVPPAQHNTTVMMALTQIQDMGEELAQPKFQGNPSFVTTLHAELRVSRTHRISRHKPAQASPRTSKNAHEENRPLAGGFPISTEL